MTSLSPVPDSTTLQTDNTIDLIIGVGTVYLTLTISFAAVVDVIQNRLRRYGALFVLEEFRQRCGGESVADVRHDIGDNTFQQIDVADFVALHNILKLYGVEEVAKVLPRRFIFVSDVCKIGHTTEKKILLKTVLRSLTGRYGAVQIHELCK